MDSLFSTDISFRSFTSLHGLPVLVGSLFLLVFIIVARNYFTEKQQHIWGTVLALLPLVCVFTRMILTASEGNFSIQEELPLHLCRLLAFMVPVMMYYKNQKWFGVLYFFIIVGTLQAIITPDLTYGPPHWSYYSYWVLHLSLIWTPVYAIVVYGFTPNWNDLKSAFIVGNIYMVATLIINILLGANYFYTMHKPSSASLLDLMGPWPIYIFVVELLAILLFLLALAPFVVGRIVYNSTDS